jgi:hypothetical protein
MQDGDHYSRRHTALCKMEATIHAVAVSAWFGYILIIDIKVPGASAPTYTDQLRMRSI